MFAGTAAVCLLLIAPLPFSPATRHDDPEARQPSIRSVFALREVRFITLVAVPAGAAVFGFVVFFAPALQHIGRSVHVAAVSTGAVGAGMLAGA